MECSRPWCKNKARQGFRRCYRCARRDRFDAKEYFKKHRDAVLDYAKGRYRRQRKRMLTYAARYRKNNPQKVRRALRKYRKGHWALVVAKNREIKIKQRLHIMDLLGGKCARCGFSDKRALQFDHMQGEGMKERRAFHGHIPYKWMLKKVAQGDYYQLLCANCNWIKRCEKKEIAVQRLTPKPSA